MNYLNLNSFKKGNEPWSIGGIRCAIVSISNRSKINRRVYPHLFRKTTASNIVKNDKVFKHAAKRKFETSQQLNKTTIDIISANQKFCCSWPPQEYSESFRECGM